MTKGNFIFNIIIGGAITILVIQAVNSLIKECRMQHIL